MIERLVDKGLAIENEPGFRALLERSNYYRLAAYWFPFKELADDGLERFASGLTDRVLIEHYEFDTALRTRIFKTIEIIEISVRRNIAYELSHLKGPFAHLHPELFQNRDSWMYSIDLLRDEYTKSKSMFAQHFQSKHPELVLPPIWAAVELFTFGNLRYFFQNLKLRAHRQKIAKPFKLDEIVLESLLVHLETIRNICAHHGRLWNVKFIKLPTLPDELPEDYAARFVRQDKQPRTIYNTLVLLDFVELSLLDKATLMTDVSELLRQFPSVERKHMGFPS